MATKYIQIGYHLPYNANSSLDSIVVDGNPIEKIGCYMMETNISDDGEIVSLIVGDPWVGTANQEFSVVVDEGSTTSIDRTSNTVTTAAESPQVHTDASITGWRWLNAKVEVDDSVTNIEQGIKDSYTINDDGVLSFNVTGVTIANSHITNGKDFQIVT